MNEKNVERAAGNAVYLIFLIGSAVGLYFTWQWIGGGWDLFWKFIVLYGVTNVVIASLKGLVKGSD